MKRLLPRVAGVLLVGLFSFFSVATSVDDGGGGNSQCGPLDEGVGVAGDACVDRDECNEVCCVCDDSDAVFVARGCDLPAGVCLGGNELCAAALEDDPTLCAPAPSSGADAGLE